MLMGHRCPVNCIIPPHMLRRLLESSNREVRETALNTLLATTGLRAERKLVATMGFLPSVTNVRRRTIFDCKTRRVLDEADLVRSETDGPTTDDAVNRAFDGLGATYDFFKTVHGRNSIDGRGMRLDAYVHYGRRYNNAFWDGRQMVFGDGDGVLFTDFTASLDVIAHELTHGVTETAAGLKYHNQPGALNESMSDVFGSLVKQYTLGQTADEADWLIGREVFTPAVEGDALRSMRAPGEAYNDPNLGRDPQPAHMDNYEQLPDTDEGDNGGVHINSGIPNKAFYLTAIGIGGHAWDAPGHIWYESLKASNPDTEFQEFADRTYTTAGRLYGTSSREQQAVIAAWREVGVRVRETVPAVGAPAAAVRAAERLMAIGLGAGAKDGGPAVLARQIEAMSKELRAVRKELDQFKQQRGAKETSKA